jgi:hypothetical protein
MSQSIATVLSVQGDVWARSADGKMRRLELGDEIFLGESVVTGVGGSVDVMFADARVESISEQQQVSMAPSLFDANVVSADEALLMDATVAEAIKILESGGDLLESLEETAAGESGSGASEGHSFFRLSRLIEETTGLTFDYTPLEETSGFIDDQSLVGARELFNEAPVASALSLTTDEDTSVSGKVIATDVDGDTLTYSITSNPANGTVSNFNAATGTFDYQPNANYHGTDTFTVSVSDGDKTVTTTVTIQVAPVNDAPVANPLTLNTNEDTSVSGKVIATDVDGDTLSYSMTSNPANGTVSNFNATTGTFDYQPNANYHGTDTFTVSVSDGTLTTTATVTIQVAPVNDAPVANPLALTTDEDTAVSGKVIATDVDGDTLTYSMTSNPANGTVSNFNAATGTFDYQPNANYHGTDTFTVSVSDGKVTTTATVTIQVAPINDAPVASPLTLNTDEDTAVSGKVIATDVDGDTLTYSITSNPANGTVSNFNAATGTFDYQPNANYHGTDTFIVSVSDGDKTVTTTVTILVAPVNDAPVASPLTLNTNEDTSVSGKVIATDVDGDTLTYSITSNPANGTVSNFNTATGTFDYQPNANYHGTDTFTVSVSDGDKTVTTTVTIQVASVNDAPVASPLTLNTNEDTAVSGKVIATDVDGDTLTYSITSNPANGTVSNFNAATGTFDYQPNANYHGTDTFTVSVSDGKVAITTEVTIHVNDTPNADAITLDTNEETAVSGQVTVIDEDDDTHTYKIEDKPANGSVVIDEATGKFTYTPNIDYHGTDTFTVTVSDGKVTTTAEVTINVNATPKTDPVTLNTDEDTAVSGKVIATDVDGDTLTYSIASNPANGTVSNFNAATGEFTYTPNANYHGTDTFNVNVTDGKVTTTSTVTLIINPVVDVDAKNDFFDVNVNQEFSGNVSLNDTDTSGSQGIYSLVTNPANGVIVFNDDGTFIFTPNTGFRGESTFTYQVYNAASNETDTATVTLSVKNLAPVVPGGSNIHTYNVELGSVSKKLWNEVELKKFGATLTAYGANGGLAETISDSGYSVGVKGKISGTDASKQLEYDPRTGKSESMLLNFDKPLISATVDVRNLFGNEGGGERGFWEALYNGQVVASGVMQGAVGSADDAHSFILNLQNSVFDSIRFSAISTRFNNNPKYDSSDYYLTGFAGKGIESTSYITKTDTVFTTQPNFSLLEGTTDPEGHIFSITQINGVDIVNGETVILASGAKLTINSNGHFTYDANGKFDYLSAGKLHEDSFTYTVEDELGAKTVVESSVTLIGQNAQDSLKLLGSDGNDFITGSSHADVIAGGKGNDTLFGGLGADTFKWSLNDQGAPGNAAVDVVEDFSRVQGDKLDISDLLQVSGSADLTKYLHFTYESAENITKLHISTAGQFGSVLDLAKVDQTIQLTGSNIGTLGTNEDIINQLKAAGSLITS